MRARSGNWNAPPHQLRVLVREEHRAPAAEALADDVDLAQPQRPRELRQRLRPSLERIAGRGQVAQAPARHVQAVDVQVLRQRVVVVDPLVGGHGDAQSVHQHDGTPFAPFEVADVEAVGQLDVAVGQVGAERHGGTSRRLDCRGWYMTRQPPEQERVAPLARGLVAPGRRRLVSCNP